MFCPQVILISFQFDATISGEKKNQLINQVVSAWHEKTEKEVYVDGLRQRVWVTSISHDLRSPTAEDIKKGELMCRMSLLITYEVKNFHT